MTRREFECPACHFPMGDGDRVSYGVCGRCVIRRRRL